MKQQSIRRILSLCLVTALLTTALSPTVAHADAADGRYTGTGQGRNGDITVSVDISGQKIQNVTVISQNETPSFWEKAVSILDEFVGKSSANEVDSVSGATLSSEGIKAAVNAAIASAEDVILGSGTASDPYVIGSAAQLQTFAQKIDDGDSAYTASYVVLGADIDLSGIENWNPIGAEGKASSNKTKLFAGSFDGRGRTVSGMKISGTYDSEANLGLFSTLGGTARVSNIVMTDVDINAEENGSWANIRAGGIAGDTQSASPRAAIVDGCSVSGSVKLNASDGSAYAGGILGRAFSRSAVINCTANANISAVTTGSYNGAYTGGIAGSNGANVVTANCAAFGTISAKNTSGGTDAYAGGITGMLSGKLYNCYADVEASVTQKAGVSKQFVGALAGQNTSTAGSGNYYSSNAVINVLDEEGSSTAVDARAWSSDDMFGMAAAEDPIDPADFSDEAFANTLNSNIKAINDVLNESALALREWKVENGNVVPSDEIWVSSEIDGSIFAGGSGEESDPYLIANKDQLEAFAASLNSKIDYSNKYVKLAENIDISGKNWTPIGGSFYRFNGDFDGDGKTITGLTVGSAESPLKIDGSSAYIGLFGWVSEHAHIHNVALNNVAIYTHSSGSAYVGGIVGRMSGTDNEGDYHGAVIDEASVNGVISHTTDKGTSFVGGIVGHMFKGAVINSMTDAALTAKELSGELAEVGGIVGLLNRGVVANCFALGSVTGSGYRDVQYDIEGMACVGNIAAVNGGYIVNCYGQGDVEALEYSIDTGVITGWVTGIAKAYNCWYNLDASMVIDGRTVSPVDPFGETVAGGVSDEWGFRFPGSLVDNINGYHPDSDAQTVADGLNASFEKFPIDIENIYGLSADSLKKWTVKDGQIILGDEKAQITYVQPDVEKNIEEEPESVMLDGVWYGRSSDKSVVVSITTENGEITETTVIEGESSGEMYDDAVSRAKFKALFGDTSNYEAADTSVFMGSGTQSDPYRIENETQLRYLSSSINEDVDWKGVYFKQTRDITVTGGDWSPIGWGIFADADNDGFGQDVVALYPFRGCYDGNNYVIKGLKAGSIDAPISGNYMGLFGIIQGDYVGNEIPENGYRTSLKNIKIEDAAFYTENRWRSYAGGLVANAQGGFEIDNCSVTGVINSRSTEDFAYAGGLAGSLMYGSVANTYTNVDSTAWSGKNYSYAAGMSGVTNRATIINSYTLGSVHADADQTNRAEAGGFIALDGGICINCYAKGDVEIVSKYSMYLGGFVGMAASSSEHRLCYFNEDAQQTVAGKASDEKRYAGKFVNESAEANAQAQTKDNMSSDAFENMLNENVGNISDILSQVRTTLGADENGSSKYHSVYYNGNGEDLTEWTLNDNIVGFSENEPQLLTALPEAVDGKITLCGDVKLADTAVITRDTILDLRGYTIYGTDSGRAIRVDSGKLTIIDSSNEKTGSIVVPQPKKGSTIAVIVNDELDMQAGAIVVSGQDAIGIRVQAGGTAAMNGGSISADGMSAIGAAAMDFTTSTFVLNDGVISVNGQGSTGIYLAGEAQKAVVSGGSITVNGSNAYGIQTVEFGAVGHEIEISGGDISVQGNARTYAVYLEMDNKLNISGGTIESITGPAIAYFQSGNTGAVTGGTIIGKTYGVYILNSANNTLNISGDAVISGDTGSINAGGNRYKSTPAVTITGGYFNGKLAGGVPNDKSDNYAKYDITGGHFTDSFDDSAMYNYALAKNYTPETYTDEVRAGELNEFTALIDENNGVVYGFAVKKILTYHDAVAPTCTKDGTVEYWEGVDGTIYADENGTEILESIVDPATGHSFTKFFKWVWNGFKKAVAWFTCENDDTHVETYDVPVSVETQTEPTCTENGYIIHKASIDVDGNTYTTTNVETLDQLGHSWSEPTWEWSSDYKTASASFSCVNDETHTVTIEAEIKLEASTESTQEADGENIYSASVVFNGVEYKDFKTEVLPKLTDSDGNDSKPDTDSVEPKSDTDNVESKPDTDSSESKTDTDSGESKPDTDSSESKTDTDSSESKPDTDSGESKTDTDSSDLKADTDSSESKTDTDSSESKTDTDSSESKTDTDSSESKTDTDSSESKTDTDSSESKTDTDSSESKTDTDSSESKTDTDSNDHKSETQDKPAPETNDEPEIKGIFGDINGDDTVDSADALAILRFSVGLDVPNSRQSFLGDVDNDEQIASADALAVLRFSVGMIDIDNIGMEVSKKNL